MFLRRFLSPNRNDEANRSSLPLGNNTRTSTTAPTPDLPGRDSVRLPEYSPTDTIDVADASQVATPNYIYYRIYTEDGAIPSKTPVPGDPFLGRIKAISVPLPHTAKTIKRSIAKVENIKDRTNTNLFPTSYSQSSMDDGDKVAILSRNRPGSTPQEPLALVVMISNSERSALESEGRGGLGSAEELDSTTPEIQYLYYLLYADDYEMASKVAIDPERPSLGRIRADSVPPPRSLASIKRCISRVERTPALAYADLFADTSSDTPLNESHISILRTDGPGVSPNEPIAIVQMPIVQAEAQPIVQEVTPLIPDGNYAIKNRPTDVYWTAGVDPIRTVHFWNTSIDMKNCNHPYAKWEITNDTNGNISMRSLFAPSSWVGPEITGSTVPVPWRLIPAGGKFYYLTTDINYICQNPRAPTVKQGCHYGSNVPGSMATLKKYDKWQMWEFIRV